MLVTADFGLLLNRCNDSVQAHAEATPLLQQDVDDLPLQICEVCSLRSHPTSMQREAFMRKQAQHQDVFIPHALSMG